MKAAFLRLLGSRKSLVALGAAIVNVLASFRELTPAQHDAVSQITYLALTLIAGIAAEDFASKRTHVDVNVEPPKPHSPLPPEVPGELVSQIPGLTTDERDMLRVYRQQTDTPKPGSYRR